MLNFCSALSGVNCFRFEAVKIGRFVSFFLIQNEKLSELMYRIVDMWNSLPFHVRSASSISSFKRGVTNFLTNTS